MKIKVQVITETEGTIFFVDAPDSGLIGNILSNFIREDTLEVIIKKQHQSGTANIKG